MPRPMLTLHFQVPIKNEILVNQNNICKEMQMFDFGQDEEGIQSFYDSLEKSAKQVDEGKCVSADEVFKELREKIYKEIKDENELIYLKELDKFNEKVDEIKRKWISDS